MFLSARTPEVETRKSRKRYCCGKNICFQKIKHFSANACIRCAYTSKNQFISNSQQDIINMNEKQSCKSLYWIQQLSPTKEQINFQCNLTTCNIISVPPELITKMKITYLYIHWNMMTLSITSEYYSKHFQNLTLVRKNKDSFSTSCLSHSVKIFSLLEEI